VLSKWVLKGGPRKAGPDPQRREARRRVRSVGQPLLVNDGLHLFARYSAAVAQEAAEAPEQSMATVSCRTVKTEKAMSESGFRSMIGEYRIT
jgi:hypothetical protein